MELAGILAGLLLIVGGAVALSGVALRAWLDGHRESLETASRRAGELTARLAVLLRLQVPRPRLGEGVAAAYWLDQSESALDLALAALTRVAELGGSPHSDPGILRDKLAIIATLMNGR